MSSEFFRVSDFRYRQFKPLAKVTKPIVGLVCTLRSVRLKIIVVDFQFQVKIYQELVLRQTVYILLSISSLYTKNIYVKTSIRILIRIQSGQWIWIWIRIRNPDLDQEGKNDPQK
jgi:hypothetical protein